MKLSHKMGRAALLCAAAVSLAACMETADAGMTSGAGAAQQSNATSNQTADRLVGKMPTDMRGFVEMAASSDMFEIQSSQLAKQKGVGGAVASFADQMIADHSATSAAMKSLLAGMTPPMAPPTEMTGHHRAMMATLAGAGAGNSFTRAYVDAQRAAHNEAVALYTAYAQSGDNPQLRQFAQTTLPALQGHLEHIRRIESMR
jgi:putative membrane protein